jgi:isopenicillin N synthase-like dioxygenase
VLDPLNHLIALALELPPDFFTKVHRWEEHDESHLRYMKYSKFSPQEIEQLSDGLWSRGHTDLGTITLLFRQPVVSAMNLWHSLVLHSLYPAIPFPGPHILAWEALRPSTTYSSSTLHRFLARLRKDKEANTFRTHQAALQIRDHETGDWKWAKPLDGSITVNTCDALSFLTGGYIKSTVHRVGPFPLPYSI